MGPVTTAPVLRTVFTIFSADLSTRLWSNDCNLILILCDIFKELLNSIFELECKGKGVKSFDKAKHKEFYAKRAFFYVLGPFSGQNVDLLKSMGDFDGEDAFSTGWVWLRVLGYFGYGLGWLRVGLVTGWFGYGPQAASLPRC